MAGPLAQLAEHLTFNERVAGSSPARLINNLHLNFKPHKTCWVTRRSKTLTMKEVIKSLLESEIARKVEEFREMKLYTSVASEQFFAFAPDPRSKFPGDPEFVRSCYFEGLLEALVREDSEHYGELHKGTPFFYLASTAYSRGDFETALYYLDLAIDEYSLPHLLT
jgi:hypothetical protein